jgi:hypothetical protein
MLLRLRQHCQSILLYRRRHSSQRIFREDARCSRLRPHRGGNLSPCANAANEPATQGRGANGIVGTATTPGTTAANVAPQDYLVAAAAPAVPPLFAARNKPLLRAGRTIPTATQRNEGDSLLALIPGSNGPTSLAAIRAALAELGLARDSDIIVAGGPRHFGHLQGEQLRAPPPGCAPTTRRLGHSRLPLGFLPVDLAKLATGVRRRGRGNEPGAASLTAAMIL